MLYKFKSQATADVIMLEGPGRQLLQALGKDPTPAGIVTVEQMPEALANLEAACTADDAARAQAKAEGVAVEAVGLRMRAKPMRDMLGRAGRAQVPITWGG